MRQDLPIVMADVDVDEAQPMLGFFRQLVFDLNRTESLGNEFVARGDYTISLHALALVDFLDAECFAWIVLCSDL